jgi:hypothetical protein
MPEQPDTPVPDPPGKICPESRESSPADVFLSEMQTGMTLERVIELTEEFEHLNNLIVRHVEKGGGFTSPDAYFKSVQPVLDMLEIEIRVRYCPGMTRKQMKLIIQDWIDLEIRELG